MQLNIMLLQGMVTDSNGFGLFELHLKSVWKTVIGPELAVSTLFLLQLGTLLSNWYFRQWIFEIQVIVKNLSFFFVLNTVIGYVTIENKWMDSECKGWCTACEMFARLWIP